MNRRGGAVLLLLAIACPAHKACGPHTVAFCGFGSSYCKSKTGQQIDIDKNVIIVTAKRYNCIFDEFADSVPPCHVALVAKNLRLFRPAGAPSE